MTTPQVGQTGGDSLESLPFNILIIKDTLDKAYGEDNVDIVRIFCHKCGYNENELPPKDIWKSINLAPYYYRIIILMPKVLVTNTHGQTHLMRDLYVGIVVTEKGILVGDAFHLNRGTLTTEEYNGGYIFSHGSRGDIANAIVARILNTDTQSTVNSQYSDITEEGEQNVWAHCCFGSGVINQTLTLLGTTFDPIMWQLFVCQLNSYVGFEDLDGGPYLRFSNLLGGGNYINVNSYGFFNTDFPSSSNYTILQWMIKNIQFSLNITNGFVEPVIKTRFEVIEDYIYNALSGDSSLPSRAFVYKSPTNQYFLSNTRGEYSVPEEEIQLPFSFKGDVPIVKILSLDNTEVQLKATIHPLITYHYIRTYLAFITLKLSKMTLYNL